MTSIKFLTRPVFLIVLSMIMVACNKPKPIDKEVHEIASLLINQSYYSYFRIPKSYNIKVDTNRFLINDKFIVLIEPNVNFDSRKFNSVRFNNEYLDEFKECNSRGASKTIELGELDINKRILLKKHDTIFEQRLVKLKPLKDYHIYMSFSNISFNDAKDKAVIWMSESSSPLDGSYDICFLKKENGEWGIIGFQNISIS